MNQTGVDKRRPYNAPGGPRSTASHPPREPPRLARFHNRMHLFQILLPLFDNKGKALPRGLYRQVATELTDQFGGLTAYTRAPAQGLWEESEGRVSRDEIVIYEVMAETADAAWWQAYRADLERRFRQREIVVRSLIVQLW